jgi:hypothetical protein
LHEIDHHHDRYEDKREVDTMSWKETIVWTVLPNGRQGQDLRLTVFVAPRLEASNPVLSQFPHFMSWPETLAGIELPLHFSNGLTLETVPDPSSPSPDPALWKRLFDAQTPVQPFDFKPLDELRIHSYPARQIESFVKQRYRRLAVETPTVLPELDALAERQLGLTELSFDPEIEMDPGRQLEHQAEIEQLAQQHGLSRQQAAQLEMKQRVTSELEPHFKGGKVIPRASTVRTRSLSTRAMTTPTARASDPRTDFLQLKCFHLANAVKKRLPQQIPLPEVDFHQMLTALAQHPQLLRRLGLAIDLIAPLAGGAVAGSGTVWVVPGWPTAPSPSPDAPSRTQYLYSASGHEALGFRARPKSGSDLTDRFLGLGSDKFSVIQIDLDGAAEKVMVLADAVKRASLHGGGPKTSGMPSLRSAGISLVHGSRAEDTANHFQAQKLNNTALESSSDVVVWAEDLLRGYRVDVLDGTTGVWRSLCQRVTSFQPVSGPPLADEEGEGWISMAATQSIDETEPDLYLQETLCRWSGWSLVARRPGKHLGKDNVAEDHENDPVTALELKISTRAAPGSLPRLRFGHSYRLRARAVDLAGNSLDLTQADELSTGARLDQIATDKSFVYQRYEPLPQPVVVLRNALDGSPGESPEHLVIRTFNSHRDLDEALTSQETQRHIAPPAAAQLTSEAHGMFDAGGKLQKSAYATIINKEGTFKEEEGVYSVAQLTLPYLPDPPVRGAAFIGLPASTAPANQVTVHSFDSTKSTWPISPAPPSPVSVLHVDFGDLSLWPELRPFRIKVKSTLEARDPEWNAAQRELTIYLPPAEIARVRLSSYLGAENLDQMSVWQWIKDDGKATTLAKRALAGMHWMMTPSRELVLVHAVQQPLITPEFSNLRSHRQLGDQHAILEDSIPISGKSTVKLDIQGDWTEPIDNGVPGELPRLVEGRSHAFELPIEYQDTKARFGPKRTFTLIPDRLRRLKQLAGRDIRPIEHRRPVVSKRRPVRAVKREAPAHKLKLSPELVASFGELEVAARTRTVGKHQFNDTRHRQVTYTATATSRFREYLPFSDAEISAAESDPSSDKRITRRSQPATIDVLSSARPPAPRIVYVIPSFGWERSGDGGSISSTRRGGGLRVYLERPWFVSGAGELLGVVVVQPRRRGPAMRTTDINPEATKPYVTQWAMDPLWRSSATTSAVSPTLDCFRNPEQTEQGLTLDELPGAKVAVAGFKVGEWDQEGKIAGYSTERELWFCDIEIDPGRSYYPFVRLALVRYQPKSIAWSDGDVKLSRVMLTDFTQLTPDRFASVTSLSDTLLKVAVSGRTYKQSYFDKAHHVGSVIRPDLEPSLSERIPAAPASPPAVRKLETEGQPPAVRKLEAQEQPPKTRRLEAQELPKTRRIEAQEQQPKTRRIEAQEPTVGPVEAVGIAQLPPPAGGGVVEVSLEKLPADATGDLQWRPVPGSTVRLERGPDNLLSGVSSWTGQVTLPEPRGSRRYRLIIKEYEWFITDGPNQVAGDKIVRANAPRLVYADVLEV